MAGETYALVLLSAAKWLTDLGIVWLVGVSGFRLLTRPGWPGFSRDLVDLEGRLARYAGLALLLLVAATVARLYAQTYASFGLDEPVTGELLRVVSTQTRWGDRWMMQGAAVVLSALAWVLVVLRVSRSWLLFGAATLVVVGTTPLTGHAMGYSGGVLLPMVLQSAHLLAAGVWIGTLFVLLSAGLRSMASYGPRQGLVLAPLVDRFSPVALTAAGTLAGTGAVTAFLYVDEAQQLWPTVYGRALLAKLTLFGVAASLGAYNWKRVRPGIPSPGGTERLRRSGTAELLVVVVLLAVTAWLVHLPMPHE